MQEGSKFKIFVVEDDEWYRELLGFNLESNPDYEVHKFESATACLSRLHENPDLITLDYNLPDMKGEEAFAKIKDVNPDIEVIVISEQGSIDTAVQLLKMGAFDYMTKAEDIQDRLMNTVHNVRKNSSLKSRIVSLEREVQKKYEFGNTIIGSSPAIKKVFGMMEKAIKTNITVTITGETGTGKEVVAKAVHFNSRRKDKPFVPVNMAAIPSELIEAELFGHEKGAFTGANNRRIGKFEEAHEGTLFLDEIGEMDITFQAKLLRALQEKEIIRIGSNKIVKTDCRIIVATNRNLIEEVKNGNFREDLYYRLFGLPIELPPLRERGKDIIQLSRFFLSNFARDNELPTYTLTPSAQKKLLSYKYPGNIRELKSIVELSAVMTNGNEIDEDVITFSTYDALPDVLAEEMTLKEYSNRIIQLYLKKYDDNIKLVAEKLDIGVSTIYRILKEDKEEA
ncbi:MAG: sigma-54 dependent transcriptional regulator [Bacteroidia bacterium]|nr:sigma-54 dependent transcriptional regulator [Bacteroidia bacterium]